MKIGIDLGGSHISIGLVDENGNIVHKEEKYIENKINIEKSLWRQYFNLSTSAYF